MKSDSNMFKGGFGIERETLRITAEGRLSQTNHPFNSQQLSRDFCENQLEIITPVCESVEKAVKCLEELSDKAEGILSTNNELLWLNSNPPHFENENEIPIARYDGKLSSKHTYRIKLARRYGRRLMLYSGIHFNLSFDKDIIGEDNNNFYMRLLKQTICYSWLPVLLTAASPVYDKSLEANGRSGSGFCGAASMRNSFQGYWNQFSPILDYSDINSYCRSVTAYIDKGVLFSAGELYLPVRIKPPGRNSLDALKRKGIDHIELRMFDLNPLSENGIFTEDLKFAHYLMLYLAHLPDFELTPQLQLQALENHKSAARFDVSDVYIGTEKITKAAKRILEEMKDYFSGSSEAEDVLDYQLNKLENQNRYADIIYKELIGNYQENTLMQMKKRRSEKYVRVVRRKS